MGLIEEFEKGRFKEEMQRIKMQRIEKIKLNLEAKEFKKIELPERYTAKLLYGWDNKKFEEGYLKKLERNWNKWKKKEKEYKEEYKKKVEESLE